MPFEQIQRDAKKVAVIGGGIAGMGAALELRHLDQVVLFESSSQLGGHARTVLAGKNRNMPVDTGFLVYNEVNYPNLSDLFKELGVPTIP